MEKGGTLIMDMIKFFLEEDEDQNDTFLEIKSTTKAALVGGGLGAAFGKFAGGRGGIGNMAATYGGALGASAGHRMKGQEIYVACKTKYSSSGDRARCFHFRNKHGKFPKNRKELEFGAPKPKGA
jgi:hypothetical protein